MGPGGMGGKPGGGGCEERTLLQEWTNREPQAIDSRQVIVQQLRVGRAGMWIVPLTRAKPAREDNSYQSDAENWFLRLLCDMEIDVDINNDSYRLQCTVSIAMGHVAMVPRKRLWNFVQ